MRAPVTQVMLARAMACEQLEIAARALTTLASRRNGE